MIDISIALATRGRPQSLSRLLQSIKNKVRRVDSIEVNHYMDIKDDAHNHMKEGLRKRGIDVNIDDYAKRLKP